MEKVIASYPTHEEAAVVVLSVLLLGNTIPFASYTAEYIFAVQLYSIFGPCTYSFPFACPKPRENGERVQPQPV